MPNKISWLDFWYQPRLYIHTSWMEENHLSYMHKKASKLVWNIAYQRLCQDLALKQSVDQEVDNSWKQVVIILLGHLDYYFQLAGVAITSDFAIEESEAMTCSEQRWVNQLSKALAISQRITSPVELSTIKEKGVWLLYITSLFIHAESWQRLRLAIDISLVKTVESNTCILPMSDKNQAILLRFWRNVVNRAAL